MSPSITDGLLRALRVGTTERETEQAPLQRLTARETEVLRLVAEGCSNREIAEVLHLAEGTVKNHLSAILAKTGSRDRISAVLRALRDGLLG
jgi:DNA-binding NarL/FixJ family response regulator